MSTNLDPPRAHHSSESVDRPSTSTPSGCFVDLDSRSKRPRLTYAQELSHDKSAGKERAADYDDAVTFVSGANEGEFQSPGRVTRAQRGKRGLELQTKLEERQQKRKQDETMVHWRDEIYAFNSRTVGEIKDEVRPWASH